MGNSKSKNVVLESAKPDILFTLPLEIRRAIYEYVQPQRGRLHLVQGKDGAGFRLAKCFDPELCSHEFGSERQGPFQNCYEDRLWQKRLLSSWGPHWRCEEEAEQRFRHGSLLGVCRTTRLEYAQVLAQNVTFEITSLHDLAALARPHPHFSIAALIVPNLVNLSVTLCMPSRLLRDFDGSTYVPWGRPPEEITALVPLWLSYADSIVALPTLRHLRLWVDHDEPLSWTGDHERLVIGSIRSLLLPNETGHISLERVDLYLPRVEPEEHIPVDWGRGTKPEVVVHHVPRQRYRVRNDAAGQPRVYYVEEQPDVQGHPITLMSLDTASHMQAMEARMQD